MVTGRVVVLKFWNDQSQFQVACPQGVHKHLVCLVWYSVVGNLERRDDDVMHKINNDVTTQTSHLKKLYNEPLTTIQCLPTHVLEKGKDEGRY